METLPNASWPIFKLPEILKTKNGKLINSFYVKRIACLLNYDLLYSENENSENENLFRNFLQEHISDLTGLETNIITLKSKLNAARINGATDDEIKKIFSAWATQYDNVYTIKFGDLTPDAMQEKFFTQILEPLITRLTTNGENTELISFQEKIKSRDINTSYGEVYAALKIKDLAITTEDAEGFQVDNLFKHWIDAIPDVPSLAYTDGCVAMAVVAMDIHRLNPSYSTTKEDYMLEMNAFRNFRLNEWSALALKPLLETMKKSDKRVHVITDMESDDLFALRIFSIFYKQVVVYIASNGKEDNGFFALAKAYLETEMPKHVTIHSAPVFCHASSPNRDQIGPHYEMLYRPPNETMKAIIRMVRPKSIILKSIEKPFSVAKPMNKEEVGPTENELFTDESSAIVGLAHTGAKISHEELPRDPGFGAAAIGAWQKLTGSATAEPKETQGGSKRKKSRRNLTRRRNSIKRRKSSKRRNSRKRRKSKN
jgi:hypothetical protein